MNSPVPTSRTVADEVREQADDPMCVVSGCDWYAQVATSEGPMCEDHAADLRRHLEDGGE
jgi:hypothetical protein